LASLEATIEETYAELTLFLGGVKEWSMEE
jgi:hypothetical protein